MRVLAQGAGGAVRSRRRTANAMAMATGSWTGLGLALGKTLEHCAFHARLGRYWREVGNQRRTRVSWVRFAQLARFAGQVVRDRVAGDYDAEFGVWRGGSLFLVASRWRELGQQRDLLGFDSFAGLPAPDQARDGSDLHRGQFGDVALEEVRGFFAAHGLDRVTLVPGWFEETAARLDGRRLALCHVDADLHDSVQVALAAAYDRVSPGGILVIDDYRHPDCAGATIAVEEFFASRPETIRQTPGVDCSAWVRKGG